MSRCETPPPPVAVADGLDERLRRVIEVHFDPAGGTAFWLDRAAARGLRPLKEIRARQDLAALGEMTPADLASRPLQDFIPRRFHGRMREFIVGQTGGTTGDGHWTAYRRDEFAEAFIEPFVAAATALGFPRGEPWLFVGPSGPHIIGKAVGRLAEAMDAADPFSVDFDPRWARKLPEGSFARRRYLQHVIDQAMRVVRSQDVGVLFTTPVVLRHLAAAMSDAQRERIRGVHYGGMALAPEELLTFQRELFPKAVHLSGYGNTLFGCCLELSARPGRRLDYYPFGCRLLFEVIGPDGESLPAGREGQVRFTRLDESMLIVRMPERDAGGLLPAPADAPPGFVLPGVRDPHPLPGDGPEAAVGLY